MRRNNSGSRSAWYRDLQRFKTSRMSDTDGNNSSFFEVAEVEPKHGFSIVSHTRLAAFLAFSSTSGTSGPFSRYSKGEKSFPLSNNPKMRSHLSFCCVTTPSCFREKRSIAAGVRTQTMFLGLPVRELLRRVRSTLSVANFVLP